MVTCDIIPDLILVILGVMAAIEVMGLPTAMSTQDAKMPNELGVMFHNPHVQLASHLELEKAKFYVLSIPEIETTVIPNEQYINGTILNDENCMKDQSEFEDGYPYIMDDDGTILYMMDDDGNIVDCNGSIVVNMSKIIETAYPNMVTYSEIFGLTVILIIVIVGILNYNLWYEPEDEDEREAEDKVLLHLETTDNENEECRICREFKISHALIPCGHRYSCPQCVQKIKRCDLCRKHTSGTLRIYDS